MSFREKAARAAQALSTCKQADVSLQHTFAPGAYARTVCVPEGTLVVTKVHKTDHITVMSQGEALVTTEHGTDHLVAPLVFVTHAGTQRVVYTLTDVFWTTVHVTDKTDLEEIEHQVVEPLALEESQKLGGL